MYLTVPKVIAKFGGNRSFGIEGIEFISKTKTNLHIVKAYVKSRDLLEKLKCDGLKMYSLKYIVQEYRRPISPLQCFKCQAYGHMASSCKIMLILLVITCNHH